MRLRLKRYGRCIIPFLLALYVFSAISDISRTQPFCTVADINAMTSENDPETSHVDCRPNVPCSYPEEVDIRIIVMTYQRPSSLLTLLESLDRLELDGDTAMLDIWIDREKYTDAVDYETLKVAYLFKWSRGVRRVHVHQHHVGIYGQWIDTWRPRNNSRELSLLLEDDMIVSPYVYRWIKEAHRKYGSRTDIAGYTLQSEEVSKATGTGKKHKLTGPEGDAAYLFKRIGTWGFAPKPQPWITFQDWFHSASKDETFHPYVPSAPIITTWYRDQEKLGKKDHMWSMWHVFYTEQNKLFTVYNNLEMSVFDTNSLLAENRRASGLHFSWWDSWPKSSKVLETWSDQYIAFPDNPVKFDWDGTKM